MSIFTKDNIIILFFGVICGSLFYNYYLAPRDETLYAIMECMKDLQSKPEYDRCAQQLKESE